MNVFEGSSVYRMRGHRVVAKSVQDIVTLAFAVVSIFNLSDDRLKNKPEMIIDRIISHDFINLKFEVISNKEWKFPVNGLYDPVRYEIKIPQRVWRQLGYKTNTRKYRRKKLEALKVVLHELGHYFLKHEFRYFDEKSAPATKEEDAEYQADMFAEAMLDSMGIRGDSEQMNLF